MDIKTYDVGIFQSNIYLLVSGDECIMIDCGDESEKIYKYIFDNKLQLKCILLTHAHGDHIAGIEYFTKRFYGVKVFVHKDDVEMLENASLNYSEGIVGSKIEIKGASKLQDGDVIEFGDIKLRVIHTPGHTMGGVCYFAKDCIFTGDTLFANGIGRSDLYGGNGLQLVKSVKSKLFSLEDDIVVYPGHGDSSTIGRERKNNRYIR